MAASGTVGRLGGRTALRKFGGPALAGIVLVVVALWSMGGFETGKVEPERLPRPAGLPQPEVRAQAARHQRVSHYVAVGTVRARVSATVAAQSNGRIRSVAVDVGRSIRRGELLATLDGQEAETRVAQAESMLEAARAELADAELHQARMSRLLPDSAITQAQMDQANARLRAARAQVQAADERVGEARIYVAYAQVKSPMAGVVERREVDPGDLAWPGRPLFVIHNPDGLRLEAGIAEGMVGQVRVGDTVAVDIDALQAVLPGTVEEIVPAVDPVSRTVMIRVALPAADGLCPGMFGRLRIALAERAAVLIPQEAVSHVGQLTSVLVQVDGEWVRRYVTLGQSADGEVEVLSGLSGGETIGWNPMQRGAGGLRGGEAG